MGRASCRDYEPAQRFTREPNHITYAEHKQVVMDLTRKYELRLLEAQKESGDGEELAGAKAEIESLKGKVADLESARDAAAASAAAADRSDEKPAPPPYPMPQRTKGGKRGKR